jgi:hypothetical protein
MVFSLEHDIKVTKKSPEFIANSISTCCSHGSKFLWRQRLVSGGGPKSCSMRLWDVDVSPATFIDLGFVGKRWAGEGGPKSCSMRLCQ